ncbi:reverse transcriptase N-terminal domain-containing protein [Orientia tsutsugamushi]|uniref:reverse transcriptase N-terminal domain-containing protein n=1 Tax=Orientia tsutsugamushi TaxID=784 RepID=UPI001CC23A7C|nr:reverse transcriptase N-terminal domain-containing protein [Orientia tsutsugamushi]
MNWKKCNKVVKNYRTRIVKAIQESRWNKAKALQCLLTHIKPVQQKLGLKRLE